MRSTRLQPPISAAKATNSTSNSGTTQAKTGSEADIPTKLDTKLNTTAEVLALFTVGDVYASLCKKSVYAPFIAQRRSRALFWL